jgi:hypothetical protein
MFFLNNNLKVLNGRSLRTLIEADILGEFISSGFAKEPEGDKYFPVFVIFPIL